MAYNKSEKLRNNIAAIRTAFDVERSEREATEQEQSRVNSNDYRIRNSEKNVVSRHLTPADREAGGALVDYLGRIGIAVHTDNNENRRILKAARQDNSEAGKIRHFKTQDGTAYGFAYKGELHLDLRRVDAELPLHEYAHLWCEALRRVNPDNWRNVVSIIRDDAASWQFVKASYPELHDADDIAEEVIAQYSGRRGAEKLRDELARMTPRDADYGSRWGNIFQNVSKAIQDFWKHIGDSLNIRYSSAEDVYDQILNDFARKVNPVAKVERYLKERDTAYQLCVEGGDLDTAAAMFEEALQEHVGNGVTPFMAVDGYRGKLDRLAHEVKGGSDDAVHRAARLMAPLVPTYSVLVPTPSHEGYATDMLALALAISEETGAPVADVLKGTPRERQYDVKRTTGKPMAADAMGIRMEGVLPQGYMPVVIDNVVHSGNTAEACVKALGKGVVLSLASAVSQERHVSSLKSLEPVIYDKNGVLIPLSERFTLKSKYLGRVMNYRPLGEGLQADSYIAGNGNISIDFSRLASGPDGGYLVKVINDHIKLMENKAMEEKKQEEAQVQQEQQPEQKKKGWNIDYTKYSMPEGVSVEKAQVFKLTRGENSGRYGVSAVVDGQRKTQVMYPNDVSAYFAKDEQGNRLASNPTVEQLVAKYFGPKGQEQASVALRTEEVEQQAEQTEQEGLSQQQEQPEQKRKGWNIDYTKYAMPDGVSVEKAQVFKMDQGDNAGKYAVTAVIDGQRKTQVMFKNDVDAYFTKDEQGNRKATAEQLVAKYFSSDTLKQSVSAKEEQQEQQPEQKKKGWNIDYTKYSMPEGAVVTNSFVKKDDKSGKYRLFATINGEFRSADLYPNDRQAFFEKNEAGERKATTEQLVAKYFAKSTAVNMGLAPADTQPQQELKHLGTYDVPVWAVAALQNGTDAYDGLQEDEIAEIEHFQEQFDGPLSFDIHTEERNEFNAAPAFGGAGETVKVDVYTFVEKVQRAQAEVRENLEEEQVIEDNGKEQQERKDEEQKRQEEDKEKKEDKQEVSAGLALQTTLLAGALHAASEHDGVWMNRQGKQAPAFMGKDTKISPFNSMVMALHSDANGYKSNLYTTFAAAKNAGVSVRGKEKGLPYNWYDWDKFVNKYIKNEVIDKAAYQALPPEERELYRVQGKKDMKPIFNIDQTTLPMQKKEEYKALVGSEDNVSEEKATPAEQQAARMERFAEMTKEYPDSIKLFRVGDNYEIYGADAEKAAAVIGLPVDRDESSEANAVSVSVTFPKEDLDTNMAKLVHEGSKVAVCDDLEDARLRRLTPEGELYAASDQLVEAIRQTGVDIDSNGATRYDAEKNTLYVAARTQTKPGQEMTLAMDRVSDVYRAAVAYTGTDSRLNRGNRERMLPEDRDKYDRLVQELTAGVMMTRQGLPATISAKNRELIPYWERELKEDPRLLDNVERDVNNAVQVIDKIAAGQQVDYAAIRGERPAVAARPRMYTIASELATIPNIDHKQVVIVRDPKEKTASVIMPAGASLDMNNEVPGMNKNRFVVALKHQDVEDVKFYNAGGALGLNQPNEFFADKQVEVAHLKQYELIQDEVIDLTDELARTSQVDIEKVAAIKNDQDEWVFYVKPSEGESVTVKPETTDLARFFSAIQTEQFDSVRQEMGQKYYALVQQHPQLKQDFMMPKVENVDLSRITSASMYKSKLHEDKACVTCVYDDNNRLTKEIDRDSKEWQRLWLVDDQKGYKVAVAAKLFETELNKGQEKGVELTQQEPVRESHEVTVDDDQEEVEEEEQQQTVRTSFRR